MVERMSSIVWHGEGIPCSAEDFTKLWTNLTIGWRNFKCFGIINIVCTVRILNILWINTHTFSNYLFRIFLELFTMRHLF